MSVIDQAFVKAFSRRTQPSSMGESALQVADKIASPPDVSIHPQSEQSAIVWVDAVADQYLRRDESQKLVPPQSRSRTGSPASASLSNHGGEIRSRGSRPAFQPITQQRPAIEPTAPTSPSSPSPQTRIDAGHPPAAMLDMHAPATGNVNGDLLQFATLPWIEASSTLFETPLHPAVSGPYYSDTVVVQENYLPTPLAAPSKPLASVSQPTAPAPTAPAVSVPNVAPQKPITPTQHAAAPKRPSGTQPTIQPTVQPFAAVWEVDAFEFSDTVIALFGDAGLIKSIGFPLDRAVSEGLQTLLITSVEAGAGRTTVATGIAIAAATAGLRVALVDATMATATASATTDGSSLADTLNLDIQFGWIEAVRGGISIAETAIHSIEDQLTVLPLVLPRAGLPPTADEFSRVIQRLRQAFDLIVIDGPPCTEASFRPLVSPSSGSNAIDATILVQDMRQVSADQSSRVMETLRRDGINGLGIVQNFV